MSLRCIYIYYRSVKFWRDSPIFPRVFANFPKIISQIVLLHGFYRPRSMFSHSYFSIFLSFSAPNFVLFTYTFSRFSIETHRIFVLPTNILLLNVENHSVLLIKVTFHSIPLLIPFKTEKRFFLPVTTLHIFSLLSSLHNCFKLK